MIIDKYQANSKFKISSTLKLSIFIGISLTIYYNWLWLTVAVDYLLEGKSKIILFSKFINIV